jgi:23S rRNA (cytosine1962-C5)-methyltransferase
MNILIAKIILKPGKEAPLKRFHTWVFSGAIKSIHGNILEGDTVEVYSSKDEFLGMGHYQNGSIAVRIFSFEQVNPDNSFWAYKIQQAYKLREVEGLTNSTETNAYRLVHAEGDGMPGLVIDFYNGTAVMQTHSVGMHRIKGDIVMALQEVYGNELKAVFDKSADLLPKELEAKNGIVFGAPEQNIIKEHGNWFKIDWETGQKTGFFIDQRENRQLLSHYSKGKKVLNTFCYTGGFSVYALSAGAEEVHSVDSSAKAIALTEENVRLNFSTENVNHKSFEADVLKHIKEVGKDYYDVIILDPPAFAKHLSAKHNAVQAYKRLNAEAMERIKPGGIIFTFSCSQVVDKELFNNTITSAAIQVGRKIKILHYLSQPADHPVNIFHTESEYLKGLVIYVE